MAQLLQCEVCQSVGCRSLFNSSRGRCCATCLRKGSVAAECQFREYITAPSTPRWFEAIGIIHFDLLLGQKIESLFPLLPFSVAQETELAFLCFPDANCADGDYLHDFIFAFNGAECRLPQTAESSTQQCGQLDASSTLFFCTSLFRQKKDPSIPRGAQQKALVLLSRYPFPFLSHVLLPHLCSLLFEQSNSSQEELLRDTFNGTLMWPVPLPNSHFVLPLLGASFSVKTPNYTEDDLVLLWSQTSELQPLSCHCFSQQQEMRMAIQNKCSIVQLLNLTQDPYLRSQLQEAKNDFLTSDQEKMMLLHLYPVECSLIELKPAVSSVIGKLRLLFDSSRYSASAVEIQNRHLISLQTKFLQYLTEGTRSPERNVDAVPVLDEIEIHHALYPHLSKCWKFWELMMIGAPIAIVGVDAPLCSAVALSLVSLISPLSFVGVLRPYLTISNREVDSLASSQPQSSTIVATSNPYFVKHFEKWPHFLCVGNPIGDIQTHKTQTSGKRGKQQFKLQNRFFCARHYCVKTDKLLGDSICKTPPLYKSYIDTSSNRSSTSRTIHNMFNQLTESFLRPIKEYIEKKMATEKPYFLQEKLTSLMAPSAILEDVRHNPTTPFERFKTEHDGLVIYDAFLRTKIFLHWAQYQIFQCYRSFLFSVETLEDVLLLDPNPATRHYVLDTLQWDFERALSQPLLDVPLLQKLSALCALVPHIRMHLIT